MKKGKNLSRLLSPVLALAILLSLAGGISATAEDLSSGAVYSLGSMNITGSGIIKGDGIITSGSLSGGYNAWATGHIYKAADVNVGNVSDPNKNVVASYSGTLKNYTFNSYNSFPETTYFRNFSTIYKDGTKDLTIGWSGSEQPSGYTISENCFIGNLTVNPTLTLNISVPAGQLRIIRADTLAARGNIVISGGGRVVLYVDHLDYCGNLNFNAGGSADKLTIVVDRVADSVKNGNSLNSADIHANMICLDDLSLNNTTVTGNLYVKGNLSMGGIANVHGLVFAPSSHSAIGGSAYICGKLVTGSLDLSGNSYIQSGSFSELPSDVADQIGDRNDSQNHTSGGSTATTSTSSAGASTTTTATTSTGDPGSGGSDTGKTVTITVAVARRMSIRLEDGRILKNGDKFTMPKYGTVRFQVCTNNWDTNTYTDDGQGIAGQKVFEYTNQKNKELYLRVDNNRYFVPVKFHFVKGDYSKLTGVKNVLSTPLESLSVNFPIGATITVDAYVKNAVVESKDLFIDSSLEWVNWNY